MKQFYTLTLVATLLALLLVSCQKELHFPEVPPTTQFTLTKDGVTYNLKVDAQSVVLKDTVIMKIGASSPEISISLNMRSTTHKDGVGDYYLWCCTNDVWDRTAGPQKHWEIDHIGNNRQGGSVTITRMDESGYEGTYVAYGNDYAVSRTAKKEFKGTFVIVY